ncbi:GFA family protein [uncultured Tateyamaria sp.]|uniref:GFA family protein n=1 Tax=uncultured Tateyamaria sp. TaxID=455651 RepID=UPI00345CED18
MSSDLGLVRWQGPHRILTSAQGFHAQVNLLGLTFELCSASVLLLQPGYTEMTSQATENAVNAGGCYCGAVRYAVSQPPLVKGQCHCQPCQRMSGGAPQYFILVPPNGFVWTAGKPAHFTHPDLKNAVTRYFCKTCGTQLVTTRQDTTGVIVKIGTLDDPSGFVPRVAICHANALGFHSVPEGVPVFEGLPGV